MASTQPQSDRLRPWAKNLPQTLGAFFGPALYRQAHKKFKQCQPQRRPSRWQLQPLVWVLLVGAWACGETEAERFDLARGFYIGTHQRRKRPGKTLSGFHAALERLPMPVLRLFVAGIRCVLATWHSWCVGGFVPLGCDGSHIELPRSEVLERRLQWSSNPKTAPSLWLSCVVHLRWGVPWCWKWGHGKSNEREHLMGMLPLLPRNALVVTDAGYIGLEMARTLDKRVSFLIRANASTRLYAEHPDEGMSLATFREGEFWYWTLTAQQKKQPPVRVRALRVRARKQKHDVWLITNVLDSKKLTRAQASTYYRWRWENEGLFRTYKRTLKKVKLSSRKYRLVLREAEGSLLSLQLLLAQGAQAMGADRKAEVPKASPKKVLDAVREEISYWQPRCRSSYRERLKNARREQRKRKTPKERRPWPQRDEHRPPKPPQLLTMEEEQKQLIEQLKLDSNE